MCPSLSIVTAITVKSDSIRDPLKTTIITIIAIDLIPSPEEAVKGMIAVSPIGPSFYVQYLSAINLLFSVTNRSSKSGRGQRGRQYYHSTRTQRRNIASYNDISSERNRDDIDSQWFKISVSFASIDPILECLNSIVLNLIGTDTSRPQNG